MAIDKYTQRAKKYKSYAPMLPETRTILDQFYAPYNRQLARLLGDDRFLFQGD